MHVEIKDRVSGKVIAAPKDYQKLTFNTIHPGGPATASFTVKRTIDHQYPEFLKFAEVIIKQGEETPWHGYVSGPTMATYPERIEVSCLGLSGHLREIDCRVDQPEQKGSDYITGVLLADSRCKLTAGRIDTTGEYIAPILDDIAPHKEHNDVLNEYWSYQDRWTWNVGPGWVLNYHALDLSPVYYVSRYHCTPFKITPVGAAYAN